MAGGDLYKRAIFHALLHEVDFVLRAGNDVAAIEVKSGRRRERLLGMEAFSKAFRVKRQLLVGEQGIPVGEFLKTPIERWLR